MKSITYLFLACAILLSGCATKNTQKYFLNAPAIGPQASSSRGVVIGSVESKTTVFGVIPDTMQVHFNIVAADVSNKDPTGNVKRTFNLVNDNLDLAATEPGEYDLTGLFINTSMTNYDFESWNKRLGHPYGVFTIAPGEVIYIGHLVLDPEGMTIFMHVEDRFDEAKAKLPPELANRMVKHLLVLPPSITFNNQERTLVHR